MPKPPYEPRTPPVILAKALLDLISQEKQKGMDKALLVFVEHMIDLEELDNSPKFQELAEGVRRKWNEMVEAQAHEVQVQEKGPGGLP